VLAWRELPVGTQRPGVLAAPRQVSFSTLRLPVLMLCLVLQHMRTAFLADAEFAAKLLAVTPSTHSSPSRIMRGGVSVALLQPIISCDVSAAARRYRTILCGHGEACNRNICFFAHNQQVRASCAVYVGPRLSRAATCRPYACLPFRTQQEGSNWRSRPCFANWQLQAAQL
jgi:hypothetical protein